MPRTRGRLLAAAFLGYTCVAVLFSWPLALHLNTALLGSATGDLGVYFWNPWVFRHEVVAHRGSPFLTSEVLALTAPVQLALHNYTAAANVAAFVLQPAVGIVATFNLLTLGSLVLSAWAMFVLARHLTANTGAAWIAGLAFGFSPFMSARATEHFSLIQAAPLPLFALCILRLLARPGIGSGAAGGACLAWAYLSDPYYAVYCALMAGVLGAGAICSWRFTRVAGHRGLKGALTTVTTCMAALIVVLVISGGSELTAFGIRISMRTLYTPVLILTVLAVARLALTWRMNVTCRVPTVSFSAGAALIGTTAVLLSPVLVPMVTASRESQWIAPRVLWRSSAPGVDLLSFVRPSPYHPVWGSTSAEALRRLPNGFTENVASVPWVLVALVTWGLVRFRREIPAVWLAFTATFLLLSLGPFVRVGGVLTYVPAPWALLRYVPVIGAARMPTRFSVLVMMGLALLAAFVVSALCRRSARPWIVSAVATALLIVETMPAPRSLHSAAIPSLYAAVRADQRPLRVLDLPFGLRDGMSSHGNTSSKWQYFQTFHEKPLLGGYLSRLRQADVDRYATHPVLGTLMRLSAREAVSAERWAESVRTAASADDLQVGYVVVDRVHCPPAALAFAVEAFKLTQVMSDGDLTLYRPAAVPSP